MPNLLRRGGMLFYHPDWFLFIFSSIALTRGMLYAFPDRDVQAVSVPQGGVSLLPNELTYIYGALWLAAGLFGVWAAVRHQFTPIARILVFTMYSVWMIIYLYGAITSGWSNRLLWSSVIFYALLGVGTLLKPKRVQQYLYVLVPSGLIEELRSRESLTVDELIEELHRNVTTPERLIMSLHQDRDD